MKKQSKYKVFDNLYRCECGREFQKAQSLNAHFCYCLIHKIALGKPPKINDKKVRRGSACNFSKMWLGDEQFDLLHKKAAQALKQKYDNGEIIPSWRRKTSF